MTFDVTTRDAACVGRYCPCRGDHPAWVYEYMPSPWAMETMHTIWLDGRTMREATDDEQAVLVAELARLVDNAKEALA